MAVSIQVHIIQKSLVGSKKTRRQLKSVLKMYFALLNELCCNENRSFQQSVSNFYCKCSFSKEYYTQMILVTRLGSYFHCMCSKLMLVYLLNGQLSLSLV